MPAGTKRRSSLSARKNLATILTRATARNTMFAFLVVHSSNLVPEDSCTGESKEIDSSLDCGCAELEDFFSFIFSRVESLAARTSDTFRM